MQFPAILAALLAALACLAVLLSPAGRRFLLDRPNERSLHRKPVPRSGGLAVVAGVIACAMLAPGSDALLVVLGLAAALSMVSLLDDLFNLPSSVRFSAHLAAAGAAAIFAIGAGSVSAIVVTTLALAWSANLYNFMDGSDGLAGGMALFGFGAYAIGAQTAGDVALATLSAGIAASAAAFLVGNFPPAKLFMGDVGSIPLGFLAGALGLIGWRSATWPLWFPMLVFAPFACDATLTLIKRVLRRERVWQAHRDHYYQRLVRMGLGHRGTLWIEYGAMAACAVIALAVRDVSYELQFGALAAMVLVLAALAVWIDARWARRGSAGSAQA